MEKTSPRLNPLVIYFALIVIFLYLPIALLVVFSFNNSPVLVFPLTGFTTKWYQQLLSARELIASLWNSLLLAVISSFVATVLGTMAAIGIVRFNFRGK